MQIGALRQKRWVCISELTFVHSTCSLREASLGTSCLSTGFEEALFFLHTKQIPDAWKMDMSEILESSSSDEGEGKESEEEEKEPEPEEVKVSSCIIREDCKIMCLGVYHV